MAQVGTLGQVVESTGCVVTPYLEYPQLLGILLRMLSEGTLAVRREVMKVSAAPPPCDESSAWLEFKATTACTQATLACARLCSVVTHYACLVTWCSQVLGIMGALDPHTHKVNLAELQGEGRLEREGVRPQFPNKAPPELGEWQLGQ